MPQPEPSKRGVLYFFRVTVADLLTEATRDPHVAAENLIQMSLIVESTRPRDVCYSDGGRTCFESLSQQRAVDTLIGVIVGHRLSGGTQA